MMHELAIRGRGQDGTGERENINRVGDPERENVNRSKQEPVGTASPRSLES